MVKKKIKVSRWGDIWGIKIGKRFATWKDFGDTIFPNTPAVFQTKSLAEKWARKLRKLRR